MSKSKNSKENFEIGISDNFESHLEENIESATQHAETGERLSIDEAQALLEKYDRESNFRIWDGIPRRIVRYLLVAFAIFAVLSNIVFHWETRVARAAFVGSLVVLIFLVFPPTKNGEKHPNTIAWYDLALALLGGFAYFYFVANYRVIISNGINISPLEIVLGIIGLVVTLEACRRAVGIPIVIVACAFIVYALTQKSIKLNIYNLFYTTEGLIGTPIRACSTFIVLFVIFGAFLERTGISNFFIDLANSAVGSASGGPAKVAVISSALCGMVSGSSVGNTVTTGSVTIPMMKKTGYRPDFAGAVEAAASTGGQIMPPIMGAAAFLMVEYSGYAYSSIALRAILPAVLYFAGIFLTVHLEARKLGLKGIPKELLPKFGKLMITNGILLLPLILLVYLIITKTMALAAILATLLAIAVSNFKTSKLFSGIAIVSIIAYSFNEYIYAALPSNSIISDILLVVVGVCLLLTILKKGASLNLTRFLDALENGSRSTLTVGVACAVAGIIACVITTTGIGTRLISLIVSISGGVPFLAMFLTMITCIILGMGVPTTANYVIMATTCAPILIKIGIMPLAAHFFVFYFGIVADITPPVALAAYAGSAIAKGNPMRTGFIATKLAIAAFIVPYIFALSPNMLFLSETGGPISVISIITITLTAVLGIFGVALGTQGHIFCKIPWPLRVLSIAGGLSLLIPGWQTDVIGLVLVGGICVYQFFKAKKLDIKPVF